uniref:Ig-like domain-containing protein n=1 Tax=Gouania willdenowi TaxID=441366 RepID=A0A8C5G745_GOUWI
MWENWFLFQKADPPLWLCGSQGSQASDCVLGIVGRPVLLPCFHPEFLTLGNRSAEWKRNDEVVLRSNQTDPLCTVITVLRSIYRCLFIYVCPQCLSAASFSSPQLHREEGEQGELPVFLCQSSGGYPEPRVYWIINDTDEPPDGSVRTQKQQLPDSNLYNITSHMTVNISKEASVSCIIQNLPMNETFTSTICESLTAENEQCIKHTSLAFI